MTPFIVQAFGSLGVWFVAYGIYRIMKRKVVVQVLDKNQWKYITNANPPKVYVSPVWDLAMYFDTKKDARKFAYSLGLENPIFRFIRK